MDLGPEPQNPTPKIPSPILPPRGTFVANLELLKETSKLRPEYRGLWEYTGKAVFAVASHSVLLRLQEDLDMALQLGDQVPNFTQKTTAGEIDFYNWAGDSWVVLFSHPADYTPVCTTELGSVAKLKGEFEKRGAKVIALSVDDVDSHNGWIGDIEETQGTAVNYPIIADADKKVSDLYGMIHPNANAKVTVRSVFIIDPNKKLRLTITYPPSTGRNFSEILRVLDSLQLTDNYSVATPVDWKDGDDVVVAPTIPTEEARQRFPKGVTEIKPYLRMTPQPNK